LPVRSVAEWMSASESQRVCVGGWTVNAAAIAHMISDPIAHRS
jgi:hypothetical protein